MLLRLPAAGPVVDEPADAGALDERRARSRLRQLSGVVILGLLVFLVVVDALGRLFVRPDFHVGDVLYALLIGALLPIIGIEGLSRLPFGGPK